MAKSWNRTETWVALIVLGIGAVIAGVGGLFIYMSATAKPIHPDSQDVQSVAQSAQSSKWNAAVEESRHIVRAAVAEQNLPGLSVAVGVAGEVVWGEGFGFADLEKKAPVDPQTRFRIGTISIPLTSAAAGLLLERKQLTLDEPIQKYVPELQPQQWPVTLRQVMGHFGSVRSDGGDEGPLFSRRCERPVEALPLLPKDLLRSEPGTEYRYSRYGWILVSAAIEAAANEPFLTFMQKQIFAPLGMDDTLPDSTIEAASSDRATSYFPKFAADPRYGPDLMREVDFSCYAGSSVFVSTPSDLVRFVMAINGGKLLKPETVQLLQTSQRTKTGQETGYGLGWDLENVTLAGKETTIVGHDGDSLGGIVSSLVTVPNEIVVAVTSNISYADTPAIALKIAQAFVEQGKSGTR